MLASSSPPPDERTRYVPGPFRSTRQFPRSSVIPCAIRRIGWRRVNDSPPSGNSDRSYRPPRIPPPCDRRLAMHHHLTKLAAVVGSLFRHLERGAGHSRAGSARTPSFRNPLREARIKIPARLRAAERIRPFVLICQQRLVPAPLCPAEAPGSTWVRAIGFVVSASKMTPCTVRVTAPPQSPPAEPTRHQPPSSNATLPNRDPTLQSRDRKGAVFVNIFAPPHSRNNQLHRIHCRAALTHKYRIGKLRIRTRAIRIETVVDRVLSGPAALSME